MFIVLINDRLLRCKYTNFSCLQMECRYFFFFLTIKRLTYLPEMKNY